MNSTTPIIGIPENHESLIIQKSQPLLNLWRSNWKLEEFKILDVYLSRIDSHHPERRCVRLEKGELEKLLQVERIELASLKTRLKTLGLAVEVPNLDIPNSFELVTLFESIKCEMDADGLWQIDLKCTHDAMKYIFNIENLGYLRYKLHSIVNLKSRHSYILFLYIEQNRFRYEWEVSFDELRHMLGCDTDYYKEYKRFNSHVLSRAQKEIFEMTSCRFKYSPVRKSRKVQGIKFGIDDIISPSTESKELNCLQGRAFLETALFQSSTDQKSEFSPAQLDEIFSHLAVVPLSRMPALGPTCSGPEMQRYHYLANKFAELNRRAESYEIRNRFAYFLSMIKSDTIL